MKTATTKEVVPAVVREERVPLLKPKHFQGGYTSFTRLGLMFDCRIGHEDRALEITAFDDCEVIERFAMRRDSRCVANPNSPSLGRLKSNMRRAQRLLLPDEEINVSYQLPANYERRWSAATDGSAISEGQAVVMVCFDGRTAVGHACLDLRLIYHLEESTYDLYVAPEIVYVIPGRRKEGLGMDLSIACGYLVRDVVSAAYRAVPPHSLIESCVSADYESEGGEAFVEHLKNSLEIAFGNLQEQPSRRTIRFGDVTLDAGY